MQDLFGHGNFALKVDFYVSEVEAPVVAELEPVECLFVQQTLYFVFVLLELGCFGKLLADLVHEVVVQHKFFVVSLEFFELGLGALLV